MGPGISLMQRVAAKLTVPLGPVASASPHHDAVQALVISPDSKWVATASLDSTIVLWDAARGALVERWVPHSYTPAVSVTFSPDSRYLVSGGDDRKAVIWEGR